MERKDGLTGTRKARSGLLIIFAKTTLEASARVVRISGKLKMFLLYFDSCYFFMSRFFLIPTAIERLSILIGFPLIDFLVVTRRFLGQGQETIVTLSFVGKSKHGLPIQKFFV